MTPTLSERQVARCLCGGQARLALSAPDYRFDGKREYQVWRCQMCGLGRTWPPLATEDVAAAYPAEYQPYHTASRPAQGWRGRLSASVRQAMGYGQPDGADGPLPIPPVLSRLLTVVRGWSWRPPPPPAGRLLDVGCGSGAYGASLLRLGWEVDGIEPDAAAAGRAGAAGLRVWAGEVMDANLAPAAYDAITLWHVLEHLEDPVAVLRRLHAALRPTGLLILEVPNFDSLVLRFTGGYWFHLDLPRHRFHFTPASLHWIMAQAGFRVQRIEQIPNPHGAAGALAYRLGLRKQPARTLALLAGWLPGLISAALHRADVLRLYALP